MPVLEHGLGGRNHIVCHILLDTPLTCVEDCPSYSCPPDWCPPSCCLVPQTP